MMIHRPVFRSFYASSSDDSVSANSLISAYAYHAGLSLTYRMLYCHLLSI